MTTNNCPLSTLILFRRIKYLQPYIKVANYISNDYISNDATNMNINPQVEGDGYSGGVKTVLIN